MSQRPGSPPSDKHSELTMSDHAAQPVAESGQLMPSQPPPFPVADPVLVAWLVSRSSDGPPIERYARVYRALLGSRAPESLAAGHLPATHAFRDERRRTRALARCLTPLVPLDLDVPALDRSAHGPRAERLALMGRRVGLAVSRAVAPHLAGDDSPRARAVHALLVDGRSLRRAGDRFPGARGRGETYMAELFVHTWAAWTALGDEARAAVARVVAAP